MKNKTKYYVIYLQYYDYNINEGAWEKDHSEFDSREEAKEFVLKAIDNPNMADVIGPLVTASA